MLANKISLIDWLINIAGYDTVRTFKTLSRMRKVTVDAVTRNGSLDTTLTDRPGGCVLNSFDLLSSPVTINSFCTAYVHTRGSFRVSSTNASSMTTSVHEIFRK